MPTHLSTRTDWKANKGLHVYSVLKQLKAHTCENGHLKKDNKDVNNGFTLSRSTYMYTYTYTVHNLCTVMYDSYTCAVCSVAFVVFVHLYIYFFFHLRFASDCPCAHNSPCRCLRYAAFDEH